MTNPPAARQERRLNLTDEECEELTRLLETPDDDFTREMSTRMRELEAKDSDETYIIALRELADLRRTREELAVRVAELEREAIDRQVTLDTIKTMHTETIAERNEARRERDEARRALVTYGECYAGGAGVTVSDDEFAAALKTLTLARAAARKEE